MNSPMSQYIDGYNKAQGSDVAKIKYLLMYFSHQWGLNADDSLVTDLLDDANITAADIVTFLESIYAIDGGNKEFSYAIQAMKVCLQKATMQDATPITEDMGDFEDINGGGDSEGFSSFALNVDHFLKQPLSHFKEGTEGG